MTEKEIKAPKKGLKYIAIYNSIKDKILSGELKKGTFLPSETELAKQQNVSTMTVVRALNELVKEHLIVRQRGVGTMVSNLEKTPLIPGRKLRIGLLWSQSVQDDVIESTFSGHLTQGILNRCEMNDIMPTFLTKSGYEPSRCVWIEKERGLFVEALGESWHEKVGHPPLEQVKEGSYDGLIVIGSENEKWLGAVLDLNIPTVLLDCPFENFADRADFVFNDPKKAFSEAVQFLADKGLKKIHFVGSPSWRLPLDLKGVHHKDWMKNRVKADNPDSLLRLSAYRHGMDLAGLEVQNDWIHLTANNSKPIKELVERLASLPEGERPEGFLGNHIGAMENLMNHFHELGYPLECVNFLPNKFSSSKHLLRTSAIDMGATAMDLLIWRLQKSAHSFLNIGVRMEFVTDPEKI